MKKALRKSEALQIEKPESVTIHCPVTLTMQLLTNEHSALKRAISKNRLTDNVPVLQDNETRKKLDHTSLKTTSHSSQSSDSSATCETQAGETYDQTHGKIVTPEQLGTTNKQLPERDGFLPVTRPGRAATTLRAASSRTASLGRTRVDTPDPRVINSTCKLSDRPLSTLPFIFMGNQTPGANCGKAEPLTKGKIKVKHVEVNVKTERKSPIELPQEYSEHEDVTADVLHRQTGDAEDEDQRDLKKQGHSSPRFEVTSVSQGAVGNLDLGTLTLNEVISKLLLNEQKPNATTTGGDVDSLLADSYYPSQSSEEIDSLSSLDPSTSLSESFHSEVDSPHESLFPTDAPRMMLTGTLCVDTYMLGYMAALQSVGYLGVQDTNLLRTYNLIISQIPAHQGGPKCGEVIGNLSNYYKHTESLKRCPSGAQEATSDGEKAFGANQQITTTQDSESVPQGKSSNADGYTNMISTEQKGYTPRKKATATSRSKRNGLNQEEKTATKDEAGAPDHRTDDHYKLPEITDKNIDDNFLLKFFATTEPLADEISVHYTKGTSSGKETPAAPTDPLSSETENTVAQARAYLSKLRPEIGENIQFCDDVLQRVKALEEKDEYCSTYIQDTELYLSQASAAIGKFYPGSIRQEVFAMLQLNLDVIHWKLELDAFHHELTCSIMTK